MGERGPVPKRSSERRRRNKDEAGPVTTAPAAEDVTTPEDDPNWHPIVKRWFQSLRESGQATYYEPSDWATALYVAEAMNRNLKDGKFSAMLFAAVMSAMTDLLTTEGARRRARLELERGDSSDEDEIASVTALSDYRRTLGVA